MPRSEFGCVSSSPRIGQIDENLPFGVGSLLPGDRAAEDVAQETNAIIWDKRGDFELGTNFKAWAEPVGKTWTVLCG